MPKLGNTSPESMDMPGPQHSYLQGKMQKVETPAQCARLSADWRESVLPALWTEQIAKKGSCLFRRDLGPA